MNIQPYRVSEPRAVNTIFGAVMVPGPFADDFTRLNWQYDDHWSGESARFRAAGLEAYVKDMDGDGSFWLLKDCRTREKIAEGTDCGFEPNHFFTCLVLAERSLREEVARRKALLLRVMKFTEETCPGHIASEHDGKICGRCGVHIDSLRPPGDERSPA